MYVIGSGVVCEVIDGYEYVCKFNGICDSWYCIEYIEMIEEEDVLWLLVFGIVGFM